MTRENKLALVVGFGLILFVGILISDHFSVVRSQAPVDLTTSTMNDPLTAVTTTTVEPVNLIEIMPLRTEPAAETMAIGGTSDNTGGSIYEHNDLRTDVLSGDPPFHGNVQHISMDPTARPGDQPIPEGFEPVDPKKANPAAFQFHDVQSGESMFAIAKQYYGTSEALESLARFNKMDDPSDIRTGQRIRIPSAQDLGLASAQVTMTEPTDIGSLPLTVKSSTESNPAAKSSGTPKPRVTYTVRKGETLRVIALKVMGSKSKWNKIYNLNRDVIDDPDHLKVGTVLRLS